MSNIVFRASPVGHESGRPHLSALAQEILIRLTKGQTVKSIASDLETTKDIVDARVRIIYRHFRVKGVALLVHAAIREGWITNPAEQTQAQYLE